MPGIALTPVDQNSQLAKIISKLFVHFSLFPKSLIKVDNVYAELCNEVIFFTAGTDKFGGVLLATSGEHASQVYCDLSYFTDELLPAIDVLFTESSLNPIKTKVDFKDLQEYVDHLERRLTVKHIVEEMIIADRIIRGKQND